MRRSECHFVLAEHRQKSSGDFVILSLRRSGIVGEPKDQHQSTSVVLLALRKDHAQ